MTARSRCGPREISDMIAWAARLSAHRARQRQRRRDRRLPGRQGSLLERIAAEPRRRRLGQPKTSKPPARPRPGPGAAADAAALAAAGITTLED